MNESHQRLIREAILSPETFVRATFSGRRRGHTLGWTKVALRPVEIRDQRHLMFSFFDAAKDTTKNYTGHEAEEQLAQLLGMPFKQINVQTTEQEIQVLVSNKGDSTISTTRRAAPLTLEHNRQKQRLLTPQNAGPLLTAVGMLTREGAIRADMQRKYLQINEFLRLIHETGYLERGDTNAPLAIVDLGCGNAYLTFATYGYVTQILGRGASLLGVDLKPEIIERNTQRAHELGWEQLRFERMAIADVQPDPTPDLVVALHACDTATDDALARGITWGSGMIVSAPCCHHQLQVQLAQQPAPGAFRAVARHAILRERMADILTDTFRALILRIMGYQTDVIEFIATEHTPRNLMIRAVRGVTPGDPRHVQEYTQLKEFWQVTPYLETLLGDRLAPLLPEQQ
jgi:SAM-dependent methyltransferase